MKSIDGPKKSARGRPKVDSDAIKARFERRLLDGIDAYANEGGVGRPEAVRRLVRDQLLTRGLIDPSAFSDLNPREDPEGAN